MRGRRPGTNTSNHVDTWTAPVTDASAGDHCPIWRWLDNGRARPATAEQERRSYVHNPETNQTPHENLRVRLRRLIALTHHRDNSDLVLQERDAARREGRSVILRAVGSAPHVVGRW